jgi:hypothetical protein
MAGLKVLAIHGCCLGDYPAERVSGGIERSTRSALKSAGFDDPVVRAPFYGSLLFSYARGEVGLFEELTGVESGDEEAIGGGKMEVESTYVDLYEELEVETIEELRLPIPDFVREWAMHTFMADVSTYLAMRRAKEAIWGEITRAWNEFDDGPDLVVAHSLGTVVAWDVLASLGSALTRPRGLLMMGSPLYLSAVRSKMTAPLDTDLPVDRWIHIYDDGDLVAGGKGISSHYESARDVEVENPAFPTSHDYPGYVRAAASRGLIGELVG